MTAPVPHARISKRWIHRIHVVRCLNELQYHEGASSAKHHSHSVNPARRSERQPTHHHGHRSGTQHPHVLRIEVKKEGAGRSPRRAAELVRLPPKAKFKFKLLAILGRNRQRRNKIQARRNGQRDFPALRRCRTPWSIPHGDESLIGKTKLLLHGIIPVHAKWRLLILKPDSLDMGGTMSHPSTRRHRSETCRLNGEMKL